MIPEFVELFSIALRDVLLTSWIPFTPSSSSAPTLSAFSKSSATFRSVRIEHSSPPTADKACDTTSADANLTRELTSNIFNSGPADEKLITELVRESHESCCRLRCPSRLNCIFASRNDWEASFEVQ